MKPEQWSRVRGLLEQAIPLSEPKRAELLDSLDAEEQSFRREVERLLAVESGCSGFLETPIGRVSDTLPRMGYERDWIGARVGAFRLERVLASGGMGIVFEAVQDDPQRKVALKMMRMGLSSTSAERRFRYEAELLGRLHHPGIAQIYEAGVLEEEGEPGRTPWFALEYVEGAQPLIHWARDRKISIEGRLLLFQQVLDAVQHGHQRGVIHRDLKPANVLVDPQGRVKVIDFGVGRRIDASFEDSLELTGEGELLGTLRYMSPEQLGGRPADVDVRSDVYALGVLLFELLCERHPHELEGLSIPEIARVLREDDAVAPSSLRRDVARDLDWIVAKAMAKEPGRRYPSASAFASDIERFLNREPVQATPPSYGYFVRKFVSRHRILVTAGSFAALALCLGSAGLGVGFLRAVRAERAAQLDRAEAVDQAARSEEMLSFLVDSLSSPDPGKGGRELTMVQFLEQAGLNIDERFLGRPEVGAWLHQVVGRSFAGLGVEDKAESHLVASIDILLAQPQPDRQRLAEAWSDLGEVYVEKGLFDEARNAIDEGLAILEEQGDASDPLVLKLRSKKGRLAIALGHFEEAEEILRDVLDVAERAGVSGEDLNVTLSYLGGLLHESGRLAEAETYYRRALEAWIPERGAEHPQVMRVRNNLVVCLHGLGKTDDAAKELEELAESSRRVLGPDHPDTVTAINNLGAILYRSGRMDEAAPFMREALEILERTSAADDPFLLGAKSNVGTLEVHLGRLDEAEPLLREVYERRMETLGADHDRTLRVFYELCRVEVLRGNFERAAGLLDEGYWRTREALGESHEIFASFELELAQTLVALEDLDGAESLLLESRDGFRAGRRSSPDPSKATEVDVLLGKIGRLRSGAEEGT